MLRLIDSKAHYFSKNLPLEVPFMGQRLSFAFMFAICLLISITALGQTPNPTRGIVLEINIVETTAGHQTEIARIEMGENELKKMISDGKAKIVASLQVRTRIGESFSTRFGERVPIQTAMLPTIRTSSGDQPAVAIPQIAYENVGLALDGFLSKAGDGLVDIKLKLEMTGLDTTTGKLTPTFTQRTLSDSVRMKESETAVLMGFVQPETRRVPMDQAAGRGALLVLLTTKPIQ